MDQASMLKAFDGAHLFQVNVTEFSDYSVYQMKDGSFLRYTTLFKDTNQCNGKLKVQTCDLHAGISTFPVQLDGDKVKLRGTWKDDKFVQRKYASRIRRTILNIDANPGYFIDI
jgi:hypothetical protein